MHKRYSRLQRDTAVYFANMSEEEAAEEQKLENASFQSAIAIDVDRDEE